MDGRLRFVKSFYSKKYGIDLARFTHGKTNVLHASTKGDGQFAFSRWEALGFAADAFASSPDAIRYHSLHDNKYLSYYKGHTEK